MIEQDIDKINESNLLSLINNGEPEGKTIEYKEFLPDNTDKNKLNFLAEVSAFANSAGGDLLIGIVEENGIAIDLKGVNNNNIDQEKLRLEEIIRYGISPKIPNIIIKAIELKNKNYIFLIRIPQSWISPHRVVFKGHDKFYARNSGGKYSMDVDELRISFNLSGTIKERISNFRMERISKILSNDTLLPLESGPKIILHLMPLRSFSQNEYYDINQIVIPHNQLQPLNGPYHYWKYNFDGIIAFCESSNSIRSYVQLYRNGNIEAVEASLLKPYDEQLLLPMHNVEKTIIDSIPGYLQILKLLKIFPPFFLFITLIDIKGYFLISRSILKNEDHKIDRDILLLPELIIERYEEVVETILKSSFDFIWNSAGYKESLNYDKNNKWNPYG